MKRALIVGISDYSNVYGLEDLDGSLNDVHNIDHLLREVFGFSTKLLINDAATCEGIKTELDIVRSQLSANDVLLFYFSGHGGHVKERGKGMSKILWMKFCVLSIWTGKANLFQTIGFLTICKTLAEIFSLK